MNNRTLLIIIAVIGVLACLAIAGVVGFYAFNNYIYNQKQGDNNVVNNQGNTDANYQEETSLEELITKNTPTKCSWTSSEDFNEHTGILYTADGQFRQEVRREDGTELFIIYRDQIVYMWGTTFEQGYKMNVGDINNIEDNENLEQLYDVSQKYKFDCNAWTKDDSVFNTPSGMQFLDFSDLTNLIPNYNDYLK